MFIFRPVRVTHALIRNNYYCCVRWRRNSIQYDVILLSCRRLIVCVPSSTHTAVIITLPLQRRPWPCLETISLSQVLMSTVYWAWPWPCLQTISLSQVLMSTVYWAWPWPCLETISLSRVLMSTVYWAWPCPCMQVIGELRAEVTRLTEALQMTSRNRLPSVDASTTAHEQMRAAKEENRSEHSIIIRRMIYNQHYKKAVL